MKVRELQERLSECPPDANVWLSVTEDSPYGPDEARTEEGVLTHVSEGSGSAGVYVTLESS